MRYGSLTVLRLRSNSSQRCICYILQIESLFRRDSDENTVKRDVSALSDILKSVPSLSPTDKQTVKTALMNKIGTLQNVSQRGLGGSLGGAALGGASSALVGNLLSEVYFLLGVG